jgi:hypothetical protein
VLGSWERSNQHACETVTGTATLLLGPGLASTLTHIFKHPNIELLAACNRTAEILNKVGQVRPDVLLLLYGIVIISCAAARTAGSGICNENVVGHSALRLPVHRHHPALWSQWLRAAKLFPYVLRQGHLCSKEGDVLDLL